MNDKTYMCVCVCVCLFLKFSFLVSFYYELILFDSWITSVAIYFEIDYQYIFQFISDLPQLIHV